MFSLDSGSIVLQIINFGLGGLIAGLAVHVWYRFEIDEIEQCHQANLRRQHVYIASQEKVLQEMGNELRELTEKQDLLPGETPPPRAK